MPIRGSGTSFRLDNAAGVLTDISTWLDGVSPSADADELDGTTFQPGVTTPTKRIIFGFATKGFSFSGKWDAAPEIFFSGIDGKQNLNYEYGPDGTAVGKTKITGTCNCGAWAGPDSSADGITTFSIDVRVNTRVLGTF